jgi:N-acetylglucosaminyl-diphospho-decaprenol L-rhamnosyltransferase
MVRQLPVVAAIPNFNMAESLRRLIPQVLAQRYDAVYVLDDASTDHSIDVANEYGRDVSVVQSRENRGAGANRNQIMDQLGDEAIIHFIDADMDLKTAETPLVARQLVEQYTERGVGVVGGLVTLADGGQEYCNYGAVFSLWGNLSSNVPRLIDRLKAKPRLAHALHKATAVTTSRWPNVLEPPVPAPAFWVHEGNMLIVSGLFRSIGGYDSRLRHHEVQDLAIRLRKQGVKTQFDPSIHVVHQHIDVRGKNRNKWAREASHYLIRKHGLYRFLTDR